MIEIFEFKLRNSAKIELKVFHGIEKEKTIALQDHHFIKRLSKEDIGIVSGSTYYPSVFLLENDMGKACELLKEAVQEKIADKELRIRQLKREIDELHNQLTDIDINLEQINEEMEK